MMNRIARRFAFHQLVHWAAVGVMVPVMTLVLRELGLSLLEIGFALAAYSLTTLVLEVPSGALSDLWGRRRTYTLGAAADLGSSLLILVAPSPAIAIVAFALRGAGRAFVSGSLDALAIETLRRESPDYDLQMFFSRVGMAVPAGLAITSLAGGFLPELAGLPPLRPLAGWSPAAGFSVNLLANLVLVGIAAALAWLLFDEAPRTATESSGARAVFAQVLSSVRFGIRTRGLNLLLLSAAAVGLVLLSVETFWQPRLDQIIRSDDVRLFGFLGSGYFAVAVLGNAASPLLVRVFGGNRAVGAIVARLASAAALAVLATQTTAAGFGALYLVFFLFFAGATPAQAAMLNELVPDERRSTLLSVNSLVLQAGGFTGSLLF
ncbi:MAG: MFS transporter, partial [Spirochaetota bacterium]